MATRNVFFFFELLFWPIVGVVSIGLMTRFLELRQDATAFVLLGTIALSVVQVCQLEVAYAVLFDVWSKSIKHQFLAPIGLRHLTLGSWIVGMGRGVVIFLILAVLGWWAFGVNVLAPGAGANFVLLLAGIYYPVSVLPPPVAAVALAIPLTHFLDAYRAHYGFASAFAHPIAIGFALAAAYALLAHLALAAALRHARSSGLLLKMSE